MLEKQKSTLSKAEEKHSRLLAERELTLKDKKDLLAQVARGQEQVEEKKRTNELLETEIN